MSSPDEWSRLANIFEEESRRVPNLGFILIYSTIADDVYSYFENRISSFEYRRWLFKEVVDSDGNRAYVGLDFEKRVDPEQPNLGTINYDIGQQIERLLALSEKAGNLYFSGEPVNDERENATRWLIEVARLSGQPRQWWKVIRDPSTGFEAFGLFPLNDRLPKREAKEHSHHYVISCADVMLACERLARKAAIEQQGESVNDQRDSTRPEGFVSIATIERQLGKSSKEIDRIIRDHEVPIMKPSKNRKLVNAAQILQASDKESSIGERAIDQQELDHLQSKAKIDAQRKLS